MARSFGDRLTDRLRKFGPLCVGLDPRAESVPDMFGKGLGGILAFLAQVIKRLDGKVGVVKPQIAFYEQYGPAGMEVLRDICAQAKDAGMLVLLDAKRGDIGATAQGYAESYLGREAWLHADAITVNPYMGLDTLEPFFEKAQDNDKGVAVLVRTSNPGAADFQEQDMGGKPLYERVAEALAPFGRDLNTGESGWSSLMAVVGATAPNEARRIRAILPRAPFLVPGFGAQGASAEDALAAAVNGEGVVVNSSRGVLYPAGARRAQGFEEWAKLFDANLKDIQHQLAKAL